MKVSQWSFKYSRCYDSAQQEGNIEGQKEEANVSDILHQQMSIQRRFKLNEDETCDWDLFWNDTTGVTPEFFAKLQPYQRVNHFPGMYQLSRKNNLCRNLMRMQRTFKSDYNMFPKTWILPQEMTDFKAQFQKKNNKTFIVKPVHLCQGKGIFLVRKFEDVDLKQGDQYVAQRYLHKPYLIDGLKFDLRIYALVYGVDPLRVFVYQEGLARFATEEYTGPQKGNLDNLFMHLTNYAIQKNSDNFVFNEDQDDDSSGHKRSLTAVLDYIREHEQQINADDLWTKMQDIIAKTIISVQPSLQHAYRSSQPDDMENSMCFEVLGFDIILDHKLKPYVLEVNALASFGTDSPLDKKVKLDLMRDTFTMLNLSTKRKKQMKKERTEMFSKRAMGDKGPTKNERELIRKQNQAMRDQFDWSHLGNYKLVYPCLDNPEKAKKFEQYLEQARVLWSEFTGGNKTSSIIKEPRPQIPPPQQPQLNNSASKPYKQSDPLGIKLKTQSLNQAYQKGGKKNNNEQEYGGIVMNGGGSNSVGGANNSQNTDKIFMKRNVFAYQANTQQPYNENPQQQQQQQQYSQSANGSSMSQYSNNMMHLFIAHQQQNTQLQPDIQSPAKKDVLETINAFESPQNNKIMLEQKNSQTPQPLNQLMIDESAMFQQMGNPNLFQGIEFQMPSTNLAEAIQKRFPMVRLEQPSFRNYGGYFYSPNKNAKTGNPNGVPGLHHSSSKKQVNSLSRQSLPTNPMNHFNQKGHQGSIFNNSNEANNPNSIISTSAQSNNSSNIKNYQLGNAYMHQQQQQQYFLIHNSSILQQQHQNGAIRPMEILKKQIHNPGNNAMVNRQAQKYQSFGIQNDQQKLFSQSHGKANSAQRQPSQVQKQPQSLADWLYQGDKRSGNQIPQQNQHQQQHHSINKSQIGSASQSLAIQRNLIKR